LGHKKQDVLAPLKKQYINFGIAAIHLMILHLWENTAIKMTTSQKFEYKAKGYGKQWGPTTSITAYFTGLDKFQTSLANRGIAISIKEMTMAAGVRMWEREMFTEDPWENKPAVQQTWHNLQDYFTEKWLEHWQYLQAIAKYSRFKDAALAAQEYAAAEEEGKTMVLMFTHLQEQHKAQLKLMAASNKQAMDRIFERMNVLITGHSKAVDKEFAPPPNRNTGRNPGGTKCNRMKCTHWGKHVFHKPADCFKLKTNASKCWAG
jgi:hypothetical protein